MAISAYDEPRMVARYLQATWGDFLFADASEEERGWRHGDAANFHNKCAELLEEEKERILWRGIPDLSQVNIKGYPGTIEEHCDQIGEFNVVMCLNVLDRHDDPQRLAGLLAQLVRSKGLLLVACSFEWNSQYTSNEERWFSTLADWFSQSCWVPVRYVESLPYEFFFSRRNRWIHEPEAVILRRR